VSWFVDWMWQGCLLAGLAALGLHVAGRLGAATRHLLWGGVLGAIVLLPLARAVLATDGGRSGAVPTVATAPAVMIVPSPPSLLVGLALALWIVVTLVLLARVARDVVAIGRLRRDSTALAPERVARLPLWNACPPGGRAVVLRVSARVRVPCALGLGRATVLLPRSLVESLSDDEVDQIVMHEYGHLARRDDWWQLAQAVLVAVAVPHPAVHWICRQLDFEREAACDEWVVAHTNAPRRYAKCLVDVAATVCPLPGAASHPPGLAPGATRAGRTLLRRVQRLVDGTHRPGRRPRLAATAAGGLAVALAVVVLAGPPRQPQPRLVRHRRHHAAVAVRAGRGHPDVGRPGHRRRDARAARPDTIAARRRRRHRHPHGNALRGYEVGRAARERGATSSTAASTPRCIPRSRTSSAARTRWSRATATSWARCSRTARRARRSASTTAARGGGRRFVPGALGPAAAQRLHVGLGADRPRLPEALLVLLGLAHRRPEAAAARRRRGGRGDRRAAARASASSRSPTTTSTR
jgi:beta-lactamase regulating signal transducer with metallopeptidase domain